MAEATPTVDGLSPGASRPLRPAVAVGAGALLAILAFPASLVGLVRLAASPAPESLSLGVIVVSAVWAWAVLTMRADGPGAPSGKDRAIAFGVLASVAVVAWLWPADELTDLGRWRPGLLLLAPFACALVPVAFGRGGLRRLAGPVALLVIAWPPLAALLAAPLVPPMLAIAGGGGSLLARLAGVQVSTVAEAKRVLMCTGSAGSHAVALAPPCSGVTSVLAVLVVAAPVLCMASGSARRKAAWVGLGCLVVAILAPLRVAVLCYLAAEHGAASAFHAFHFLGGTVFFVIVWAAMLALTRVAGLSLPRLVRVPGSRWLPAGRGGWCLLASTFALAVVTGAANLRMHARARFPRPEPPLPRRAAPVKEPGAAQVAAEPVEPIEVAKPDKPDKPVEPDKPDAPDKMVEPVKPDLWLADVPGHERWHFRSLPWTRTMYGPKSRMERFVYAPDEGTFFWVDVLVVSDFAVLERHTALGCYRWHGYALELAEALALAEGVPARRFVFLDKRDRRWISLTWIEQAHMDRAGGWRRTTVMRRTYGDAAGAEDLRAVAEFARLLMPPRPPRRSKAPAGQEKEAPRDEPEEEVVF